MDLIEDVDDVSYDAEADGRQVRRELGRRILSRGAWPTVMYLYQDLDPTTEQWRPAKVAILRFQRRRGMVKKHASLTLAEAGARQLADQLTAWFSDEARAARGDDMPGRASSDDGDDD